MFCKALSIGNPSSPSIIYEGMFLSDRIPISLRVGAEADFLFEKKLSFSNTSLKNNQVSGQFYMAEIIGNFFERLDVGIAGGGSILELESCTLGHELNEKSDLGYSLRVHGKLLVLQVHSVCLSFDGRYFLAKAKNDTFFGNDIPTWFRFQQWQASIAISTQLAFFSPYIGGVFNATHCKISPIGSYTVRGEEKEKLGVFLGLTLCNHNILFWNFEMQFFSEISLGVSAQVRF